MLLPPPSPGHKAPGGGDGAFLFSYLRTRPRPSSSSLLSVGGGQRQQAPSSTSSCDSQQRIPSGLPPGQPGGEKAQMTADRAGGGLPGDINPDVLRYGPDTSPQLLGSKPRLPGAQPREELRGMASSELTDDPLWPTVQAARVQMGSLQQLRERPRVNLGLCCSYFQMLRFIWGGVGWGTAAQVPGRPAGSPIRSYPFLWSPFHKSLLIGLSNTLAPVYE